MTKLLRLLISLSLFMSFMFSQNDENPDADKLLGNVTCVGAIVEYTYVTREMESADDEEYGGSYEVIGSWPSSANPQFQQSLASYQPGDTVTTRLVPLVNDKSLIFIPFELFVGIILGLES